MEQPFRGIVEFPLLAVFQFLGIRLEVSVTKKISEDTIRGAKAIAHELGWSVATLHRMKGRLPLYKDCTGGRTSPLAINREDIEAFKRRLRG